MMMSQTYNPVTIELNSEFDPAVLKAATANNDTAIVSEQLENWSITPNASIYVQWVPDEFTEDSARTMFGCHGSIDRIEFVYKMDKVAKSKPIGRMMFIHYKEWYNTEYKFPQQIASVHPAPLEMNWIMKNRYGAEKTYILKCRVNMRPIPKVEYNCSQLTDMFETLKAEMSQLRAECATIREENRQLSVDMAILQQQNIELRTANLEFQHIDNEYLQEYMDDIDLEAQNHLQG